MFIDTGEQAQSTEEVIEEVDIKTQLDMGWDSFITAYEVTDEISEQEDNNTLTELNGDLSRHVFLTFSTVKAFLDNPNPDTAKQFKSTQRVARQTINEHATNPDIKYDGQLAGAVETAKNIINPVIHHPELTSLVKEHSLEIVDTRERKIPLSELSNTEAPKAPNTTVNWDQMSVTDHIEISAVSQPKTWQDAPDANTKTPIQMVTISLEQPEQEERGLFKRLISRVSKFFGETQPEPKQETYEIYAKNPAIPSRYRNVLNEYRRGNKDSAYAISRGIGRENDTTEKLHDPERERELLRTAVKEKQPWAKEFLKIFNEQRDHDSKHRPELRIKNALEDHKNGNLTRAYHTALKHKPTDEEKAYLNQPGEEYKQLRKQFAHLVVEAQHAKTAVVQPNNSLS